MTRPRLPQFLTELIDNFNSLCDANKKIEVFFIRKALLKCFTHQYTLLKQTQRNAVRPNKKCYLPALEPLCNLNIRQFEWFIDAYGKEESILTGKNTTS